VQAPGWPSRLFSRKRLACGARSMER